MSRWLVSAVVVAFGLAVGSFLNVVRYRIPRGRSIVKGRSMCPNCGAAIAWHDNVPLLGFIILKRRCRRCGWRIPWIYPAVEIATAASFLLIWATFPPAETAAFWVLAALLIACAGADYDMRVIPDRLTLPGIALGFVFSLTLLRLGSPQASLVRSLLGMAVGGGFLFLVGIGYKHVRGIEGMGGGDVKLMAMVGTFLGYKLTLLAIFVASVAGAVVGLALGRRSGELMKKEIPFGVFLSPAAILATLWGDRLIDAYLALIR